MDFRFSWRDMPIDVVVDESADEAEVRLRLTLGKLPFTAENADLRAQVRYLQIRRQELPLGAVEVDGEQTMHFVACVPLAGPVSSDAIVATVAQILLRLSPYLPLLQARRRR